MTNAFLRHACIITLLLHSEIAVSHPDCLVPFHDPAKPCGLELNGDRLIVNLNPEDIKQSKYELARVTKENIPTSMQGGAVFNAYLIRRSDDKVPGQSVWTLRVTQIYTGKLNTLKNSKIEVVSPSAKANGALFLSNRKYRVFAIKLRGRLYVWNATVVQLN